MFSLVLFALSLAPYRSSAQDSSDQDRAIEVPILAYHHLRAPRPDADAETRAMEVAPEAFEASMRWLVDHGFHTVSMANVADALDGRIVLPPNPIVVSFDDGWAEDFDVALPILEHLGLTATFYVYPAALDEAGRLTWDEVRALDDAGMEIGSHSLTHPHLPALDDADLLREVTESRGELEGFLGHPVTTFAYPYGEYDARVVAAVGQAGYRTATTVVPGIVQRRSEHIVLHRVVVTPDAAFERVASAFEASSGVSPKRPPLASSLAHSPPARGTYVRRGHVPSLEAVPVALVIADGSWPCHLAGKAELEVVEDRMTQTARRSPTESATEERFRAGCPYAPGSSR